MERRPKKRLAIVRQMHNPGIKSLLTQAFRELCVEVLFVRRWGHDAFLISV